MSTVIDVHTPDGDRHRHVSSAQNGELETRHLADGAIEIIGLHLSPEVRGRDGGVLRPATRREEVLGRYSAGSKVVYVGHGPTGR
ncbi:hypothetical protein [Blastococcus haudaquaticus]|uniref:hypothetical protein n=1 Tax=Blastococcus haudaquaticus TaxID=1938745 RepID=UPI0011776C77|nr:hypothetical protein [Blastococcus haudaquaticus]